MKSKIINKEPEQPEVEYPCLMKLKAKKTVFLMSGNGYGVCVFAEDTSYVGDHISEWASHFKSEIEPFTGTIELSNE